MSTEDQGPGGDIRAPAASQGARAIGDILAALAGRLPEPRPAERRVAGDDKSKE